MADEKPKARVVTAEELDRNFSAIERGHETNIRHHQIAQEAARKFLVPKKTSAYMPDMEYQNKLRCVIHERNLNRETNVELPLHTAPVKSPRKKPSTSISWSLGSYVKVSPEGRSQGGPGYIVEIDKMGRDVVYSVKYDGDFASTRKEDKISIRRLTQIPLPMHISQLAVRQRRILRARKLKSSKVKEETKRPVRPTPKGKFLSLVKELKVSIQGRKKKGWRKTDLGFTGTGKGDKMFLSALCADYREVRSYLDTAKELIGKSPNHRNQTSGPVSISIESLAFAWGVGKNRPRMAYKEMVEQGGRSSHLIQQDNMNAEDKPKGWVSVIDCRQSAKSYYTPKRMFVLDRLRKYREEANHPTRMQIAEKEKSLTVLWKKLPRHERERWEADARSHDNLWPTMKDRIIVSLQTYGSKSFVTIASDIDEWCSATAIYRWLTKYVSYHIYKERILPLISQEQKNKQKTFAKHLMNHWDLPRGQLKKILWVHYDEKWFYGMVARANAKMCEELGIERRDMVCYHREYVNKVMVVAFTGYAFEGHIETGGHGVKLGLVRVQCAKIAQRLQRKGRRDEYGTMHYDGEVIRKKGDVYMKDVNVSGSKSGTSKDPQFSLLQLFQDFLFPKLANLTKANGEYAGYIPVIQGDNASPHEDRQFKDWVQDYCQKKGWYWRPQAPQMPYANNLDLAVFPMMSKRHSALLKENSNHVPEPDTIYAAAEQVWSDMPSALVARGFVLAYRIAKLVWKHGGDNAFLSGAQYHKNVRKDFLETAKGIKRKPWDTPVIEKMGNADAYYDYANDSVTETLTETEFELDREDVSVTEDAGLISAWV